MINIHNLLPVLGLSLTLSSFILLSSLLLSLSSTISVVSSSLAYVALIEWKIMALYVMSHAPSILVH